MSLTPPNLSYRSKSASSITVLHEPPTTFVAPSTAWARTVISAVGSKGDDYQVTVTAVGATVVVLGPLAGEQTYTVTAVAVSDADELSIPTFPIKKYVTVNPWSGDFAQYFEGRIPPVSENPVLSHEAVALFLDGLEFELSDGRILAAGNNIHLDILPEEANVTNADDLDVPDHINVVCRNEPVAQFGAETHPDKVDAIVAVAVYGGNRDMAGIDAARLYKFFQQRINVQFSVCGFTAHFVRPIGEPTFVGIEDSGLSVYQFRLQIRGVRTDLR